MAAKLFELSAYRSGFQAPNGVVFPEVYRVDGYYFDLVEGNRLVPSNREAPRGYSLTDQTDTGLANTHWTPLKRLDPSKDAGWVVVRHHMQSALAEGYYDALSDLTAIESTHTYKTKEGLFTLMRRAPPPGAPEHLLIYITKVQLHRGQFAGEWVDTWQIIHPDGSVTDDFDALVPDHETDGDAEIP